MNATKHKSVTVSTRAENGWETSGRPIDHAPVPRRSKAPAKTLGFSAIRSRTPDDEKARTLSSERMDRIAYLLRIEGRLPANSRFQMSKIFSAALVAPDF